MLERVRAGVGEGLREREREKILRRLSEEPYVGLDPITLRS